MNDAQQQVGSSQGGVRHELRLLADPLDESWPSYDFAFLGRTYEEAKANLLEFFDRPKVGMTNYVNIRVLCRVTVVSEWQEAFLP